MTQESTYRQFFREILKWWSRNWTKRLSKPVEYELFCQNCVALTFTTVTKDMIQKKTDGPYGKGTCWKYCKKPMNIRVRRVALFRFERLKTAFFSVRDSRTVTLNLSLLSTFQYIQSDPSFCFEPGPAD